MNNEMLKKRIIEQIKEPWDEKRVFDYVESKRMMGGKSSVVFPMEDAVKFDLLRINAYLFNKGELEELYGLIGQIRDARLDATIGKVEKGSSK